MSTRATYSFAGKDQPPVTVYIHHDGYPAGAACYFWNMHHCARKGAHALQFIVANENAELTHSHQAHGDTEYRYSLEGDTLTAEKRYGHNSPTDCRSWHPIFVGDWWEFVNKHAPGAFDGFEVLRVLPDVTVYGNGQRCVFSRTQLVEAVEAKKKYLAEYSEQHPTMRGNIWSIESDIERAEKNLAAFDAMNTFEGTTDTPKAAE